MVRQQEAFTTLLQNWDKYRELLEVSQTSQGTAVRKYAAYEQSLEYTQKQAKAAWEAVANSSEITEVMKSINTISSWIAKAFPYLMEAIPAIVTYLAAMAEKNGVGLLGKRLIDTKNGRVPFLMTD